MNNIGEFFKDIAPSLIAQEEYSDISTFVEDPINYLDITSREMRFSNPNSLYTEVLNTDGKLYMSIDRACNELIKVNAYNEAIALYSYLVNILKRLSTKNISKDDINNLNWSIDEARSKVLNTIALRDEYTSKRKSVVARYSDLIDKISK